MLGISVDVHMTISCPYEVFRVSWLKAKARYDRWNEELQMVQAEMFWTTLWFKHQEDMWERRFMQAIEPGHRAYAAKQQNLWERFRKKAEEIFQGKMARIE